jgi:hypothetical protein
VGVKLGLSHEGKNIKLRVFENRVLRKMFRSKRGRKLDSEELHYVCSISDVI